MGTRRAVAAPEAQQGERRGYVLSGHNLPVLLEARGVPPLWHHDLQGLAPLVPEATRHSSVVLFRRRILDRRDLLPRMPGGRTVPPTPALFEKPLQPGVQGACERVCLFGEQLKGDAGNEQNSHNIEKDEGEHGGDGAPSCMYG